MRGRWLGVVVGAGVGKLLPAPAGMVLGMTGFGKSFSVMQMMAGIMLRWPQDDLVIIVSLSGETPSAVEFAQLLRLRDIPFISIIRLHDNTLAGLSTVNLYVSPAEFQLYAEADRPQFKSMMPYFLLVEIWYVKYKIYLQKTLEE